MQNIQNYQLLFQNIPTQFKNLADFIANTIINQHIQLLKRLHRQQSYFSKQISIKIGYFLLKIIANSIEMLGLIVGSKEKKDWQFLMKTKISSQQPISINYIKYFINNYIRTGRQLQHFLKKIKKLVLTPHTVFKILMFVHAYLQSGQQIKEQTMISFMNFLLFHCTNFIQLKAQKQNINSLKMTIIRTQMSTRQEQISESKQILIHNTAKIYIRYLLKIISIYEQFKLKRQSHFVWMMINLMKGISSFTNNFILIGRYFMKEYGNLVVSTIEMFTGDVVALNQSLKKYISHNNRILSSSASSSTQQIEQFVKMLTEINSLNQNLFQIYLGKYFYEKLEHIEQPQWINTNSNEFDTMFKISQANQKNIQLNKLEKKAGCQSKKSLTVNMK